MKCICKCIVYASVSVVCIVYSTFYETWIRSKSEANVHLYYKFQFSQLLSPSSSSSSLTQFTYAVCPLFLNRSYYNSTLQKHFPYKWHNGSVAASLNLWKLQNSPIMVLHPPHSFFWFAKVTVILCSILFAYVEFVKYKNHPEWFYFHHFQCL